MSVGCGVNKGNYPRIPPYLGQVRGSTLYISYKPCVMLWVDITCE
ncbi:MAG: hypothetical protein ACYCXQ_00045 [Candidatus Humimicrobiaceae bacterium]